MALDFTCTNINCRIRVFVGDYTPPLNSCPECLSLGVPGSYISAPTVSIPLKGLEEAIKDEMQQILGDLVVETELSIRTAINPERVDCFKEVQKWLKKKAKKYD